MMVLRVGGAAGASNMVAKDATRSAAPCVRYWVSPWITPARVAMKAVSTPPGRVIGRGVYSSSMASMVATASRVSAVPAPSRAVVHRALVRGSTEPLEARASLVDRVDSWVGERAARRRDRAADRVLGCREADHRGEGRLPVGLATRFRVRLSRVVESHWMRKAWVGRRWVWV